MRRFSLSPIAIYIKIFASDINRSSTEPARQGEIDFMVYPNEQHHGDTSCSFICCFRCGWLYPWFSYLSGFLFSSCRLIWKMNPPFCFFSVVIVLERCALGSESYIEPGCLSWQVGGLKSPATSGKSKLTVLASPPRCVTIVMANWMLIVLRVLCTRPI